MSNFIEDYWIKNSPLWNGRMVTRFPPEPNGYSHIGHAKSQLINFGLAEKFGGVCHLRMDDTNPEKESEHYAESIIEMVRWMGFHWAGEVKYASDHFDGLFLAAKDLIERDLAYMDFTPKDRMREMRGTLKTPGTRSPDAENPISWHHAMFEKMARGDFDEGSCCLRAKIDMESPNINLRDPVLYRIKKIPHNRTGDKWMIYPAYDYAHPFCDGMEGISLSLCTLEFEDHRPFYDWVINRCSRFFAGTGASQPPVEMEFARLELDRGLTSKRKINALVEAGLVDGWDDPRLVTLAALRRRGFTPSSLRAFCEAAGVSKANSIIPFSRVEDFLRLDLDERAERRIVVARPVALDILEGPEPFMGEAPNHPKKPEMGVRPFAVSSAWWIDANDVRARGTAEAGFKRVEPGAVFRVMHGLVVKCIAVEANEAGIPVRVTARATDKKPRRTIHGLSRTWAVGVEIWEPETLAGEDSDPKACLVVRHGYIEPLGLKTVGTWHAVRYGYCVVDRNCPERLILTTPLRSVV